MNKFFTVGLKKTAGFIVALSMVVMTGCGGNAVETKPSSSTVTESSAKEADSLVITEASAEKTSETSTEASAETSTETSTETSVEEKEVPNPSETSPYKDYPVTLPDEWLSDQNITLADPAPWNLYELKQVVDVHDPRSVAAYWVWAVNRLTDDYNGGMEMMKYLFADLEPFGSGFTEGGNKGQAGWDSYFNERLSDDTYRWLPRAYFDGASKDNGFKPATPVSITLLYNKMNTETYNAQSLDSLGRLNIVYRVQSNVAGNGVNIELSRFDGSDRWYVTNGASSGNLFYQQSGAGTNAAKTLPNDESTEADHEAFYGKE